MFLTDNNSILLSSITKKYQSNEGLSFMVKRNTTKCMDGRKNLCNFYAKVPALQTVSQHDNQFSDNANCSHTLSSL